MRVAGSGARSGVCRKPRPANDNDLEAMRRIDALFTERPFFGARRIARTLSEEGFPIDRKRVRRLMRRMGIEALGPKPRTSIPAPGHKIYPCLLRDLTIDRPNQVWAADITYIRIGRGFLYLVAVIDWASRAVLSWRLSNTMDGSFCGHDHARRGPRSILKVTRTNSGSRPTACITGWRNAFAKAAPSARRRSAHP